MFLCPLRDPAKFCWLLSHCGVCGSDLHVFLNHRGYEGFPEQFTFGHEFSGVIQSIGSGVSGWQVGDRAVVVSVQGCLEKSCPYCSIGFSQLLPQPEKLLAFTWTVAWLNIRS